MMPDRIRRFGFLLMPGFPMACLTSAIEPLRAANEIAGEDVFSWRLIAENGQSVRSSAGVLFQADSSLAEARDLDLLMILAAPQSRFADPPRAYGRLRHLVRHGMAIGAVSGGVFPLARSGLLEGQACSVHWCYRTAFEAEFPGLRAEETVIVRARSRLTAAGAAAGFEIMLGLIEEVLGREVMTETACWFQHPFVRAEGVPQKRPAYASGETTEAQPPLVKAAMELFSRHLEYPISTRQVAERIGLSQRQLERLFRAAVGESPARYYRRLRMLAARQLVLYSGSTLTGIAQSVGYSDPSVLSRYYRDCFGCTPQEERRRINRLRVTDNRPLPDVWQVPAPANSAAPAGL